MGRTLILMFALASVGISFYSAQFAIDYSVYYVASKFVLPKAGEIYGEANVLPWPMWYRYPPLFLYLVFPLMPLPYRVGAFVWTLGKCAALWRLLGRLLRESAIDPNWWLVAALALPYVVMEFRYANAQFFVFALVAWALLDEDKRPGLSGALLGLAIAVKIWPFFFVPYLAARNRWRPAATALITAAGLTMLPALHLGWSDNLHHLTEWYSQESTIAADAGSIWFPSQSLFGVMTRYLTEIDYSAMPDSSYWNVNFTALDPATVKMLWLAVTAIGYGGLLATARSWKAPALSLHGIAFCGLVLLQPFTQKQSALVVLLLPALAAGCCWSKLDSGLARGMFVAAAALSVLQPAFATGEWQRTFQLHGLDALVVALMLLGLALGAERPRTDVRGSEARPA